MIRLILIALLALPAAPAIAGEMLPPCCASAERPPARSAARTWFRDENPARLGVAVARGPAADVQGFMAAAGGLTPLIGDGCGPVAPPSRVRTVPGT